MLSYILRRILLIFPTLLGILALNFALVQAAPGGPVERMIAQIKRADTDATAAVSGAGSSDFGARSNALAQGNATTAYRGAQGLDPALVHDIEKMYGFDKPPLTRFVQMTGNYLRFDFGKSFFRDTPVLTLLKEKLPVSLSLGLWTTLIIYGISIPLGIMKAVRAGSRFDVWSSAVITIGYAIPSFLFAILLIVLFAGGNYWSFFPLRGLTSDNWESLSWLGKIKDYFWHITLPVLAMVISGFAGLTFLTKNSFLDEINKQYVMTARAKGLSERDVLLRHVFRNAMLIVISGFPGALLRVLFTSSLLMEIIFSLDGLGLLGFEATMNRDYPIMFGTLYIFTLLGLICNLLSDLIYVLIDPRIDFSTRGV